MNKQLAKENTICVCRVDGKEVGRIPASAPNADAYISELARHHKTMTVDYEQDRNAWLLTALHSPR
jgi:hypothetical protein